MMSTDTVYHVPVLLSQSVELLIHKENGIYLDATLGGGGHSAAFLKKLGDSARLIGLDQDEEALKETATKLNGDPRFSTVRGNFGFFDAYVEPEFKGKLDGIFADLGVSSHQIDEAERGFSFQQDGPLDMRMSSLSGLTAQKVVNEYDEQELKRIFFEYGEERFSSSIARKIVEARPLKTTFQLKKAILSTVSGKYENKTLARIFQAIRIEVNRELEMLRLLLEKSQQWLAPEGRLVILSYHSLEDRLVKHFMRSGNFLGVAPKDMFGNDLSPFRLITKKPIEADDDEQRQNTRSRSARLRAAELKCAKEIEVL